MRFLLVLPDGTPTCMHAPTLDAALYRICGSSRTNASVSLTLRSSSTTGAHVRVYGAADVLDDERMPRNSGMQRLLDAEAARRGYVPSEFVLNRAFRGVILLVLFLASGDVTSLTLAHYALLEDAASACAFLDALPEFSRKRGKRRRRASDNEPPPATAT
jgi:hypothetical protein